ALSSVPEGDALADLLTYHVVSGTVGSGDLSDGQVVTTVEGSSFTVSIDGSDVTLTDESGNTVSVVLTDVPAENGVIHVIDAVLQPTQPIATLADRTPALSTLRAALEAGELVETLNGTGPFTVFAPVNDAFAAVGQDKLDILLAPENQALLQKVLTYHVLPGEVRAGDLTDGAMPVTVEGTPVTIDLSGDVPMVNAANITATDIEADNGVVHLIDAVLTENLDIVDVATLNGFSTLVDLVVEAGLESTLRSDNGGNGWTVFAPTDEAFAALSSVPTGQALVDVLTYHVVSGTVESGDLSDGQIVTTVEGSTFTVNIAGSDVTITDGSGNTVSVVLTDVPAANGVIHVIDEVILPS
ncbi:MAG: fasciclin domain-containing protein, partial [Longimicrobiales bacterium]|nr:fasciclin domain-containing protein [Longimicrobiales bacterium]